jgi:hypothetical protein
MQNLVREKLIGPAAPKAICDGTKLKKVRYRFDIGLAAKAQ